jgi:hypothetical protein
VLCESASDAAAAGKPHASIAPMTTTVARMVRILLPVMEFIHISLYIPIIIYIVMFLSSVYSAPIWNSI